MEDLKMNPITIDDQINFVNSTRQFVIRNPDAEIMWPNDAIDLLRAVETSLIALKITKPITVNINTLIGEIKIEALTDNIQDKFEKALLSTINAATFSKSDDSFSNYEIGQEVIVEIENNQKSDFVIGHIKHYEGGKPVVMTYYGVMHKVEDPKKIKKLKDE